MLFKTVLFWQLINTGGIEEQKPHDKKQHNNQDECSMLHLGQGVPQCCKVA